MQPDNYPADYIQDVKLRNGAEITIRPIRPDDAPRLQEGFKRLSPETIFLRFLETFKELTDEQAHYFANVDYTTRMALVATIQEDGEERLVGVARYSILVERGPQIAEAAIVVRDDYQNCGLGTQLMRQLIQYARQHNVTELLATTHMSNRRILSFIQRSGFQFEKMMLEPGTWEIIIKIDQASE